MGVRKEGVQAGLELVRNMRTPHLTDALQGLQIVLCFVVLLVNVLTVLPHCAAGAGKQT